MDYVYYIYNNVKYLYNSMNPATLSGAIDVIVVEQPDGTLLSTPFHVRFGKYGVFNYENKYVDIEINSEEIDLKMKLGENGVAFFVEKISEEEDLTAHLINNQHPDELGSGEEMQSGPPKKPKLLPNDPPSAEPQQAQSSRLLLKRSPRRESAMNGGGRKRDESSSSDESGRAHSPPKAQEKRTPHASAQQQQQQRQKKPLPFSSSIYSCRRNRSLPDLSNLLNRSCSVQPEFGTPTIAATNTAAPQKEEANNKMRRKKGHSRKTTFGASDLEKLLANKTPISALPPHARKVLQHSISASAPLKDFSDQEIGDKKKQGEPPSAESTGEEVAAPSSSGTTHQTPVFSSSPSSDDEHHEEDEAEDHGLQMKPPSVQQPTTSDLADGALSDSEFEKNRNAPHLNDPEWKWGEIPKSTKQKDASRSTDEDGTKKSRWTWFRWSRQTGTGTDVIDGTAKNGKTKKEEEKGLYLQDLGSDPSKLEKYFGKRSGAMSISSNASNMDSGNGVSPLGTSPCSPSALSLNGDLAENVANAGKPMKAVSTENLTPTAENSPIAIGIKPPPADHSTDEAKQPATQKAPSLRGRLDSGQSEASCATDLNLSDEESVIVVNGGPSGRVTFEKKAKYKRSLRLSSDQLKLLNLDYGSNDARFSITTKLQGTAWCSCHIYLMRWDDKLVISDIDGTITKSDVLGHVIPAIGGTWAHSGVAELYTRIKNNGYQMVYLSSRAIGQSHYTKTYLQSIAQGSQTLPDGPVLLSPTSVLMAFRKEVIERRPEEFKIACLTDLKSLFPDEQPPFFAGFGNRETDVKSYQAVGIPLERILIIDPSGMLRRADKIGFVSDYATMAMDTVDYIFPPIPFGDAGASRAFNLECSEFNTWRTKPQQFDYLVDAELEAYEARRKQRAAVVVAEKTAKKGKSAKK